MSESVDPIARLAKFTPAAGGLDRDAVVFAAGRASVRHGRVWPALAGALALSQVVTLLWLWPARSPEPLIPQSPVPVDEPSLMEESPVSPAAQPGSILWYRGLDSLPSAVVAGGEMVGNQPILRAGSHRWE